VTVKHPYNFSETGLFCKISDPGDLAGKVIKILKNKQLREKIINNSRLLITKKYDWDIIADEFSEIYERI
jgi:glycosyltransferase involved in cell wall biosynthesis